MQSLSNEPEELFWKFMGHLLFFDTFKLRFSQPGLDDPEEARPILLFERFAAEDYEGAKERAIKFGYQSPTKEDLESMFLRSTGQRYGDVFPMMWPCEEPRLRKEPFHTMEELDRCIAQRAIELCRAQATARVGILSLSNTVNEALWARCADEHRGVAVRFRAKHPFFARARSIDYTDQPIGVSINGGWVRIGGRRTSTENILERRDMELPPSLFFQKRESWKWQHEFRIVEDFKDSSTEHWASDKYGFPVRLVAVPPAAIHSVVIGYRATSETIEKVKSTISQNPLLSHVGVTQRHDAGFAMTEVRLR